MQTGWQNVADGRAGILQILATLERLKNFFGTVPAIRAAALTIAATSANNDQAGHVARLAQFVRSALIYVADPINAEWIQTPDVLLLEINSRGHARGDCDDHCLLFASLAESLGVPCQIVGVVSHGGSSFDHVIVTATVDGVDQDFDLCAKNGEQPMYSEKLFAP